MYKINLTFKIHHENMLRHDNIFISMYNVKSNLWVEYLYKNDFMWGNNVPFVPVPPRCEYRALLVTHTHKHTHTRTHKHLLTHAHVMCECL